MNDEMQPPEPMPTHMPEAKHETPFGPVLESPPQELPKEPAKKAVKPKG